MLFQPIINFSSASSYNEVNLASFYRNQWTSFKGSPTNFGFIGVIPIKNNSITLGGRILNETIGIHDKTEIKLDYAYRFQTNLNSAISFSLSPKINIHKSQYQLIETTVNNDPNFNTGQVSIVYPNAEFGTYYYSSRFYIGFSAPNLFYNQLVNNSHYSTQFSVSRLTYYLHSGYKWTLNTNNNIYSSFYLKTAYGAPTVASFNIGWETFKEKLLVGISYRTNNELVALLKLKLQQFTLGYAFQYSLTTIAPYNNGTHEILLSYRIKRKKTVGLIAPRF
jgi:type IX secretion system PorP/SprF family membrane protein